MYSYTGCTDCTQYKTVKLTPEPVHTAPTSYLSLVSYIHQGVNTYICFVMSGLFPANNRETTAGRNISVTTAKGNNKVTTARGTTASCCCFIPASQRRRAWGRTPRWRGGWRGCSCTPGCQRAPGGSCGAEGTQIYGFLKVKYSVKKHQWGPFCEWVAQS